MYEIQEGWRGRLLLVENKKTRNEVVLKAMHKESTTKIEFFREFHYNYYLSPHTNILNAYDVAFQSGDYYVFAQEFAPFGALSDNLNEGGLAESYAKKIAPQIISALEFMHYKDLIHCNINADNILVYNIDFSEVKICDFGATTRSGAILKRNKVDISHLPPEVLAVNADEDVRISAKFVSNTIIHFYDSI